MTWYSWLLRLLGIGGMTPLANDRRRNGTATVIEMRLFDGRLLVSRDPVRPMSFGIDDPY